MDNELNSIIKNLHSLTLDDSITNSSDNIVFHVLERLKSKNLTFLARSQIILFFEAVCKYKHVYVNQICDRNLILTEICEIILQG